ncbi:NnrU family protein [Roseomonas sp. PWR1]|uniref:NnrU family protein n=1 Tax=Roseomonas nitratireducens TaxID=2820810 RepID=A0ABS4ASB6_9PROT|nr:NnrU family protein [Neoroseomonas nitratireducens]MBP0464226.1 NnrU family protein [Neoroseomonas nitratireducens]
MEGWGEYALAWALFLASNVLPARPALRGPLVRRVGEARFAIAYSAVSLAILAWLVAAAGRAPAWPLWGWAPWQAWVPNLMMPVACVLLALGAGIPNPFSIGGARACLYDPARPGVLALTRHPVLWAVTLWAGAHVPPNGDLAHVLMFGGFAAFGLAGMRALDRRRRRAWGAARWAEMAPRQRVNLPPWRVAAGLAAWGVLAGLHADIIGVPPWPVA